MTLNQYRALINAMGRPRFEGAFHVVYRAAAECESLIAWLDSLFEKLEETGEPMSIETADIPVWELRRLIATHDDEAPRVWLDPSPEDPPE